MNTTRIIDECIFDNGLTLIFCNSDLPRVKWKRVMINGEIYNPIISYGLSNSFALNGEYDFDKNEVSFIE